VQKSLFRKLLVVKPSYLNVRLVLTLVPNLVYTGERNWHGKDGGCFWQPNNEERIFRIADGTVLAIGVVEGVPKEMLNLFYCSDA
jgi:hypothetical protein